MTTCMQSVTGRNWTQESYETSTGDARRRATELRAAGYAVTVSSLGSQVTPLGLIRTTLVDIRPGRHQDTTSLPAITKTEWPR